MKAKLPGERTRIKWVATLMVPWCWVIGTVSLMAWHGETFPRAAVLGVVSAVGGLILWLVYHFASGRYDSLRSWRKSSPHPLADPEADVV